MLSHLGWKLVRLLRLKQFDQIDTVLDDEHTLLLQSFKSLGRTRRAIHSTNHTGSIEIDVS